MRPQSYIDYLIEFHATRDFFECHELLEEYWKNNPNDGYSEHWVSLIQIAVGQYHERRHNHRGAMRMYQSALHKLDNVELFALGLNQSQLKRILEVHINACKQQSEYMLFDLPIVDADLLEHCKMLCKERGLVWGSISVSEQIVDRHKLRDRSEVIQARLDALAQKNTNRK